MRQSKHEFYLSDTPNFDKRGEICFDFKRHNKAYDIKLSEYKQNALKEYLERAKRSFQLFLEEIEADLLPGSIHTPDKK